MIIVYQVFAARVRLVDMVPEREVQVVTLANPHGCAGRVSRRQTFPVPLLLHIKKSIREGEYISNLICEPYKVEMAELTEVKLI